MGLSLSFSLSLYLDRRVDRRGAVRGKSSAFFLVEGKKRPPGPKGRQGGVGQEEEKTGTTAEDKQKQKQQETACPE